MVSAHQGHRIAPHASLSSLVLIDSAEGTTPLVRQEAQVKIRPAFAAATLYRLPHRHTTSIGGSLLLEVVMDVRLRHCFGVEALRDAGNVDVASSAA